MNDSTIVILKRLNDYRPVTRQKTRTSIAIRWVATFIFGALFPISLIAYMMDLNFWGFVSQAALLLIAIGGMLVILSGWIARKKHGVDGQWGFAPLDAAEIEEFYRMADVSPEIGRAVDQFAVKSASFNSPIRGRDLMFFRKQISLYKKKGA